MEFKNRDYCTTTLIYSVHLDRDVERETHSKSFKGRFSNEIVINTNMSKGYFVTQIISSTLEEGLEEVNQLSVFSSTRI